MFPPKKTMFVNIYVLKGEPYLIGESLLCLVELFEGESSLAG